jgi:hypothetical protein
VVKKMAKTGKKSVLFDVSSPDAIEIVINEADRIAHGVKVIYEYSHIRGLKVTMIGPKDKINTFEYQLRSFVDNELKAILSGEREEEEDDIEIFEDEEYEDEDDEEGDEEGEDDEDDEGLDEDHPDFEEDFDG